MTMDSLRISFITVWLLAVVGLGQAQTESPQADATVRAEQHVRTALQFELDGDYTYRERLLALATRTDPDCAAARWQQGQLRMNDEWVAADDPRSIDDELRATYRDMRDKALGDPQRELKLARWCHRNQLADVARLHYTRLLMKSTEPKVRREAVKRLDLKVWNGQLVTAADWQRNTKQAKTALTALKKWRPKLERLRERADEPGRVSAIPGSESLAQLVTLGSLPAVESFVTDSGPHFGEQLVVALDGLPHYEATQTLLRYAILSPWTSVQDAACDALQERSLHQFVPHLLAALESPIKTRYSVTVDREGNIRYQHLLMHERRNSKPYPGNRAQLVHRPVPRRRNPIRPERPVVISRVDRDSVNTALTQLNRQAQAREAEVQARNYRTNALNAPVFRVLEQATGLRMKRYPEDWRNWWQQYNETGFEQAHVY